MIMSCEKQIKEVMLLKIEGAFYQEDLKEKAIHAIAFKRQEGFYFGDLTVLHHEMFSGHSPDIYMAAAAVELLVLSSDIFDDLQDKDNLVAPWTTWDPSLTLNLAVGILCLSSNIINELQIPQEIKNKFGHLNLKAVNGQHHDLINFVETEEQYIDVATQKAGSITAIASLIGASLATTKHLDLIEAYAIHFGVAEQIKNDINDIFSSTKNDWESKKKSLPILYLMENNIDSKVLDYYEGVIAYDELHINRDEIKRTLIDSGAIMYANVCLKKQQLLAEKYIDLLPITNLQKSKLLNLLKIKEKRMIKL